MPSLEPDGADRDLLFQQFARIGAALSSPPRLRLLGLLAHGSRTLEELARLTGQTPASASAQLKVLRGAALVSAEKAGRFVWFRLANEEVLRFWLTFRDFSASLLPEAREIVRDYFENREGLARLTPGELARELQQGRVTLIDLRPAPEYAAGHLPDAVNIPFATLEESEQIRRYLESPPEGAIYAYCRGPWCVAARDGVEKLRALGLPVERLRFSYPEWQAEGLEGEARE